MIGADNILCIFFRISLLLGVGRTLQEPCLQEGQQLDGACISRLFAQRSIWVRPTMPLTEHEILADTEQHLITDMLPVGILRAYFAVKNILMYCPIYHK